MLQGLLLSAAYFVFMLTRGIVPTPLFRFLLCQGTVHEERAGRRGWRAAVVQKERPADGEGRGAGGHVGRHHAHLRKARPGASQCHAAAAVPFLSVSHTPKSQGTHFLDLGFTGNFFCTNIWRNRKGKKKKKFDMKLVNCNSCLVRWFLRKYPGNAGCSPVEKEAFQHPIGKKTKYTYNTRNESSLMRNTLTVIVLKTTQ